MAAQPHIFDGELLTHDHVHGDCIGNHVYHGIHPLWASIAASEPDAAPSGQAGVNVHGVPSCA